MAYPVPTVNKSWVALKENPQKCTDLSLFKLSMGDDSLADGNFYYGFRIVNGKMDATWIKGADIFFNLIGDRASTGKVSIFELWLAGSGMKARTYIDMIVATDGDLGDVQVVELGISGGIFSDSTWFVNDTTVYHDLSTMKGVLFPCYHWIGKDTSVSTTSKTTTLNDIQQKEILLREREIQLEKMKGLYRWQFNDKYLILPSCIDVSFPEQLPMDEQFSRVKNIDFTADALKALVGGLEGALSIPEITSVEDYFGLNCKVAEKELQYLKAGRWTSDVEFGRQILNGVNPVIIRKCTKPTFEVASYH